MSMLINIINNCPSPSPQTFEFAFSVLAFNHFVCTLNANVVINVIHKLIVLRSMDKFGGLLWWIVIKKNTAFICIFLVKTKGTVRNGP